MRFLLDYDPEMGMRQEVELGRGEGSEDVSVTLISQGTNIQAALDANARCRGVHTHAPQGDQTWGNHVASIPTHVWETFCRENPELRQWTKDAQVWLLKRLNSGEYCYLKTFDGRA